jgi:chromosome partitioning protein
MRKIACYVQKGGVGKTTCSGNIGYALSQKGLKTLLLDCDPQGNLTTWFVKEGAEVKHELVDVLSGKVQLKDAISTITDKLSLLSTFSIGGELKNWSETRLIQNPDAFKFLFQDLADMGYDVIIADLSPGLSLLERSIILCLDEIITPFRPELFGLDGLSTFRESLAEINKINRKNIQHRAIIINDLDVRKKNHVQYFEAFKNIPDYKIFSIGTDTSLSEAQNAHKSIQEYYSLSRSVTHFEEIAQFLYPIA